MGVTKRNILKTKCVMVPSIWFLWVMRMMMMMILCNHAMNVVIVVGLNQCPQTNSHDKQVFYWGIVLNELHGMRMRRGGEAREWWWWWQKTSPHMDNPSVFGSTSRTPLPSHQNNLIVAFGDYLESVGGCGETMKAMMMKTNIVIVPATLPPCQTQDNSIPSRPSRAPWLL